MARYNTFQYGDGTLYGTSPANSNLLWTLIVDWDGDGYYTGENEATRMVDLKVERGRDNFINPGGNGFERYRDGKFTTILNNDDGRYDPFNSSSPLYPNVTPGKFFRLLVKNTNTANNYPVMRGTISDIQPISGNRSQVRLTGLDGTRWLRERNIYNGLHSSTTRAAIASSILTYIGWPDDEWGSAKTGFGVDSQEYWWGWQEKALDALYELVDAECGAFFINRSGAAVFRGRDYAGSVVKTITQDQILKEIVTPQPWEIIRNTARVYSYPKISVALGATSLFTLRDTPPIADGETVTINAVFRYDNQSVCGSSLSINFAVNAAADGSGADLTAGCTESHGTHSAGVPISITNNSGTNGYIISLYTALGNAIYAPDESILEDSDATSEAAYGPKVLTINSRWLEQTDIARSLATQLVSELKDPILLPIIQIEARPTIQFELELFDRITLTLAALSIDDDYRVGKIEHKWLSDNGQAVRTVIKTEPYYSLT